jgi:hypothetical protein
MQRAALLATGNANAFERQYPARIARQYNLQISQIVLSR